MSYKIHLPVTAIICAVILNFSTALAAPFSSKTNDPKKDSVAALIPLDVQLSNIDQYIGQYVRVCGKVHSVQLLKHVKNNPTLMNLGGENANERIEVRIQFKELDKFKKSPEDLFLHKDICIVGTVSNQYGFTELTLTPMEQQELIKSAQPVQAVSLQKPLKRSLQSPAYLFASPGINEPIIGHLKKGSIILPLYTIRKWVYVSVIEKAGVKMRTSQSGFVRIQAIQPVDSKGSKPGNMFTDGLIDDISK